MEITDFVRGILYDRSMTRAEISRAIRQVTGEFRSYVPIVDDVLESLSKQGRVSSEYTKENGRLERYFWLSSLSEIASSKIQRREYLALVEKSKDFLDSLREFLRGPEDDYRRSPLLPSFQH